MNKKIVILYHGSKNIIDKPTFRGGKESNDYGYGFYCTESKELASEWACPDNKDGYANEYALDLTGLKILDLTKPKYSILNWIALLLRYRIPGGMTPNDEVLNTMSCSVPYANNAQVVVLKADAADQYPDAASMADLTVAVEAGSAGEEVIAADSKLKSAGYTASDSQADALLGVKSGNFDYAVLDYTMASNLLASAEYADLAIAATVGENEFYAIGFRKGSDLTARVNEIIRELTEDGTLAAIAAKYGLTDSYNEVFGK